jgi:hypothetical protein
MEEKKIDWMINALQGKTNDLDKMHQSEFDFKLGNLDTYANKDAVKKSEAFQDIEGNFSKEKFKNFYDAELEKYNQYKNQQFAIESVYDDSDVDDSINQYFGTPSSKLLLGQPVQKDPARRKKSIYQVGVTENPEWTVAELGRMAKGYTNKEGKWIDLDEQINAFNVPLDVNLAIAVDDKGQYKLNENGDYHYEDITGKDSYNRQVFSRLDGLTDEGSFANKFDYINSNDVQKSIGGQIAKMTTQIGLAYIPYVGQVYVGATLFKEGAKAATEVVRSIDSIAEKFDMDLIDDEKANTFQGFLKQFDSGQSQYASENPFTSFEGWSNIVTDIVLQLKQQTALGMLPMQTKALANNKIIAEYAKKNGKSISSILSDTKELEKVLDPRTLMKYKKMGDNIATTYMATTSAMGIVDQAKAAGLDETDQGVLYPALIAGFFGLFKSNIGSWALASAGIKENSNAVMDAIQKKADKFFEVAKTYGAVKQKGLLQLGKDIGEEIAGIYNNAAKGGLSTFGAAATAESLEEGTEVVLQESLKSIYNGMSKLGFTSTKDKNFDTWGEEFLVELAGSAAAGAVGGAIFKGMQGMPNLSDKDVFELQQAGYTEDMIKAVDKSRKSKKGLGSKDLSINFERKDGKIVYNAYDSENPLDINHNDFIADLIKQELYNNQFLLKTHGLDKESIDKFKEDYKELYEGQINHSIDSLIESDVSGLTTKAHKIVSDINKIERDLKSLDENTSEYKYQISKKDDLDKQLKYINDELTEIKELRKGKDYLDFALFQLSKGSFKPFFENKPKDKNDLAKAEYQVDYDSLSEKEKIKVNQAYSEMKMKEFNADKETFKEYKKFFKSEAKPKINNLKNSTIVKNINGEDVEINPIEEFSKNLNYVATITNSYDNKDFANFIEELDTSIQLSDDVEPTDEQKSVLKRNEELTKWLNSFITETTDENGNVSKSITEEDAKKLLKPILDNYINPLSDFTVDETIINEAFSDDNLGKILEPLYNNLEGLDVDTDIIQQVLGKAFREATKDKPLFFNTIQVKDFGKPKTARNSLTFSNISLNQAKQVKQNYFNKTGKTYDVSLDAYKNEDFTNDLLKLVDHGSFDVDIYTFQEIRGESPFEQFFNFITELEKNTDNLRKLKQEVSSEYINPISIFDNQYKEINRRLKLQQEASIDESTPYASLANELELAAIKEEIERHFASINDALSHTIEDREIGQRIHFVNRFIRENKKVLDKNTEEEITVDLIQQMTLNRYLSSKLNDVNTLQKTLQQNKDDLTPQIKSKAQKTFLTFHKVFNEVLRSQSKPLIELSEYKLLSKVEEELGNQKEIVFNEQELAEVYKEMIAMEQQFKSQFDENQQQDVLTYLFDQVNSDEISNIAGNEIEFNSNEKVNLSNYQKYQHIFTVFNSGTDFYAKLKGIVEKEGEHAPTFEQEYSLRMLYSFLNSKNKNPKYPTTNSNLEAKIDLINSVFINGIPGVGKTLFMQRMLTKINNYGVKYYAPGNSQLKNSESVLGDIDTATKGGTLVDFARDLNVELNNEDNPYEEKNGVVKTPLKLANEYKAESSNSDSFEGIDILFFDEATNIELKDLDRLTKGLKAYNEKYRSGEDQTKLVIMYLGDTEQFGATTLVDGEKLQSSLVGYGNIFTTPKLNQSIRQNWKQLNSATSQIRNRFKYIKEQKKNRQPINIDKNFEFDYSLNVGGEPDFVGVFVGENSEIDKNIKTNLEDPSKERDIIIVDSLDANGQFEHAAEIEALYGKDALTKVFTPEQVQGREAAYVVVYSDLPTFAKSNYQGVRISEWFNTILSRTKQGIIFKGKLKPLVVNNNQNDTGVKESFFDNKDFLKEFKEERLAGYTAAGENGDTIKKESSSGGASSGSVDEKRDYSKYENKVNTNFDYGYDDDLNDFFGSLDISRFSSQDKPKLKRALSQIALYKAMIDEGLFTGSLADMYSRLFENTNNKLVGNKLTELSNLLKTGTVVIRRTSDYTYGNNQTGKAYSLAIKADGKYFPIFHIKKDDFTDGNPLYKEQIAKLRQNEEIELGDFSKLKNFLNINKKGLEVRKNFTYKYSEKDKDKAKKIARKDSANALKESDLQEFSILMEVSKPFILTGNLVEGSEFLPKGLRLGVPYVFVSRNGKKITKVEDIKAAIDNMKKAAKDNNVVADYYAIEFDTIQYEYFSDVLDAFNKIDSENTSDYGKSMFRLLSFTSKVRILKTMYDKFDVIKQSYNDGKLITKDDVFKDALDKDTVTSSLFLGFMGKDIDVAEDSYDQLMEFFKDYKPNDPNPFKKYKDKKQLIKIVKSAEGFDFKKFFKILIDSKLDKDTLNEMFGDKNVNLFKGVSFGSAKGLSGSNETAVFLDDDSFSSIFNDISFFNEMDLEANYKNILQAMENSNKGKSKAPEPTQTPTFDLQPIIIELDKFEAYMNDSFYSKLNNDFKKNPNNKNASNLIAFFEDAAFLTGKTDYDIFINELNKFCAL